MHVSVHVSVHLSAHVSVYVSAHASVHASAYVSVHVSVHVSVTKGQCSNAALYQYECLALNVSVQASLRLRWRYPPAPPLSRLSLTVLHALEHHLLANTLL